MASEKRVASVQLAEEAHNLDKVEEYWRALQAAAVSLMLLTTTMPAEAEAMEEVVVEETEVAETTFHQTPRILVFIVKSANRWLDLRWFFVKDAVAQGHVDIRRVDTKKNAADGFTKALAKEPFETFVGLIGMICRILL
ncbi:hypothetical protein PDIDSM_9109 [Penicillium digitatum]|nr:hypothetical protein PDIDSM_9109 [Penicillium digitatum]